MLGIEWDKFKDTFIIDLHKIFTNGFNSLVTKCNILRLITSIYDPLGIILPIVVLFKIYFQKLTTLKNNWDTDLNLEVSSEWLKLFNSLQFSKFTMQRFYLPSNICLTDRKFDVHGFSDASKNAYEAVVYLACSNYSILLASEICVSPLEATSIPHLELMTCLLLSELIEIILSSISNSINIKNVLCWLNSLDSLFWIKGENKSWKPFIQNCVNKIRKIVHPARWYFCPGNKNPADLPSPGIRTSEFCSDVFCNWIKGPTLITKDESCWPVDASNSYLPQDVQIVVM